VFACGKEKVTLPANNPFRIPNKGWLRMTRFELRSMTLSLLAAAFLTWAAGIASAEPAAPNSAAAAAPRELELADEEFELPPLAVARIGGSRFSAPEEPSSLAISPDGRALAVSSVAREVCLFDSKTGRRLAKFDGAAEGNLHTSFSADGKLLAAAGYDGKVRVWNLTTGAKQAEFVAHGGPVLFAGFLPGSNRLVTTGADETLRFWDANDYSLLKSYDCAEGAGERRVAIDERSGSVYFVADRVVRWDPKGGKPFRLQPRYTAHALQLSSAAKLLCVVSLAAEWEQSAVQIFDADTAQEIKSIPAGRFRFSSATLAPDGKRLAVGSSGAVGDNVASAVRMLDWRSGKVLWQHEFTDCVDPDCITFSPDAGRIYVCFGGNLIRIFDAASGRELLARRHECCEVTSVRFGTSSQSLLIASGTDIKDQRGRISLWDLDGGHCRAKWQVDCAYTSSASFAPDERRLVSQELGGDITLRDAEDGHVLWRSQPRSDGGSSISRKIFFRNSGKDFVLPEMSGSIHLVDAQNGNDIKSGETPPTVHDAALSSRGTTLALAKSDASVVLWNIDAGQRIASLDEHSAKVLCVAFAPADRFLVSGGKDMRLRVWDLTTGKTRTELTGHKSGIVVVSVSPDGNTIVSGDETGEMIIWDVRDGRMLNRWKNEGAVTSLSFSSHGDRLACANRHGRVLIWDYEKLRMPGGPVGAAPSGRAVR
jgi:WD40 repeat protein